MIRARYPTWGFPATRSIQLAEFVQQREPSRWIHRSPLSGVPSLQAIVAEYLGRHLLKDDGPLPHVGWADPALTERQKACKSHYLAH